MDITLIALAVLAIPLLIIFGVWLFKPKMYEIPEEERYVIYEQGLFKKIVGPGPVLIWESFENIERKIKVRNEPTDIVVNELFIYDIPFGYKLNYWSRFDPAMLHSANPRLMAELVQFDDNERHQQVIVKVRDALVNSIVKVQVAQGGMPESLIGKILLIVPGLDGYNAIMEYVRAELASTLPTIGIRLDSRQPITTTKLYLMPGIVDILNQERIAEHIENIIPGVSRAEKIQTLSSIEGLTIPPIYNISSADLASGNARAELDIRQGKDGPEVRTRIKPGDQGASESAAEDASAPAEGSANNPQDAAGYKLKPSDLAVLKRVA